MSAPSRTAGPAVRPSRWSAASALLRALTAATATLRAWRSRVRERAKLPAIDAHERRDLPYARDCGIASEMAQPFCCAYLSIVAGKEPRSESPMRS